MIISGKHTIKKPKRIGKKMLEKKANIEDSTLAKNKPNPNISETSFDECKISDISFIFELYL